MITDQVPRNAAEKQEYLRSDSLRTLELPPPDKFRMLSQRLEEALKADQKKEVKAVSNEIAVEFAAAFKIKPSPVNVLGARPLEITETSEYELFGDYTPSTTRIRLWMRTAVHQRPTAFGTFLSTLCHELCHHLDVVGLELPNTFHTRGFYERAGLLYHHVRGTPVRPLVWVEQKGGRYRINWAQTMRGSRASE